MSQNTFKPIHQPDGIILEPDSRPSSVYSATIDRERVTPIIMDSDYSNSNNNTNAANVRNKYRRQQATDNSLEANPNPHVDNPKFLHRRSSSAMRVRELRDVLASMTSSDDQENGEHAVSGSQNARLLVASQQRLVSRLQDMRHELDSMDNEVARVRSDIIKSRRYFSAMTGNPCGPAWPHSRRMDSAYTSPVSFFISRSSDASPYNSSDDSISTTMSHSNSTSSFQTLQQFESLPDSNKYGQLSRSDSCSSFLSWRSDVELAGVFPEESVTPLHVPAQKQFSQSIDTR